MSFLSQTVAGRALPVFEANGWTYGDGEMTHEQLEDTVRHLLASAKRDGLEWTSSGRFTVHNFDGMTDVCLVLATEIHDES